MDYTTEQAKRLVRDPGFQYAFRMHAILQLLYSNNKEERHRQYELAGIRESLEAVEDRLGIEGGQS